MSTVSKATIFEVADKAHVSIATVSRVLNNPDIVSKKTLEKVHKAMGELDYFPSGIAQSLMTKSTKTIGVVVADISNPYYAELFLSIQQTANELGYMVIICNSLENMEQERTLFRMLLSKNVDLILLVGGRGKGDAYNHQVIDLAKQVPVILCNEYIEDDNLFCVVCDKEKGAYEATKYLISLGHKRIGFINGLSGYLPSIQKDYGYRKALSEAGIPVRDEYITVGNYHIESSNDMIVRLFSVSEKPTAVLCSNDLMAMGAIKALEKLGYEVPEDVSVVGFDDIGLSKFYRPGITSVSQKMRILGETSIRLIPKVLNGTAEKKTVIQPELIIRESCGYVNDR